MRVVPKGIHRRAASADKPPTWYEWIYRGSESDGQEVILGRSQRLDAHLDHKFYPQDGTWPRKFHGAIFGAEWLLECWLSARARSDATHVDEAEDVWSE
jgi:hypothetical protein